MRGAHVVADLGLQVIRQRHHAAYSTRRDSVGGSKLQRQELNYPNNTADEADVPIWRTRETSIAQRTVASVRQFLRRKECAFVLEGVSYQFQRESQGASRSRDSVGPKPVSRPATASCGRCSRCDLRIGRGKICRRNQP